MRLVDEHIAMCADQSSFAGIQFALWPSSPMQAGARLLTSYDDWTVNQFARHIGENPPGQPTQPERFKQRADWILGNSQRRQKWIQWRCDRMTDFYNEVAAHLAQANSEAKLRLVVQQPYPWYEMDPAEALREQGIDMEALSGNSDIVITRFTNQTFHRIARLSDPAFVPPGGIYLGVITDYDALELTRQFQRPFSGLPRTGAIIHQQYYESHPALRGGSPKLHFPEPWWTEGAGRCSQPAPRGDYFLRHPALDLYLFDAQWLAIGGYNLGTRGFEEEIRRFATTFCALPRVPFADLGCTGPVVIRQAQAEGHKWIYAVNITDNEARLSLRVADRALADVVTGNEVSAPDGHATFNLLPYWVLAWRTSPDTQVELRGASRPPVETALACDLPDIEAEPSRHVPVWSAVGLFDKSIDQGGAEAWAVDFDKPLGPELTDPVNLEATYPGKNETQIQWRTFEVGDKSFSVNELYDYEGMDAVVYLASWVKSPEPRETTLHYGADWGLKVWLNGEKVVDNSMMGGPNRPLGAQTAIQLNQGWNRLLVKSVSGSVGWWASVGLSDPGDLAYSPTPPATNQ